jgi:pimeloyl-ACP methyl ester carboxylesterase
MEEKVPAFARGLAALHGEERWKEVVHRTRAMIGNLGAAPPFPDPAKNLGAISQPCLAMVGDRDAMVSVEETRQVQKLLPTGSLAVLPRTPHPIGQVDTELLAFHLRRFFENA